ncbi:MAG: formate dehydrogenase accessory protein FdhE [Isosphaeraceae bacterium]
MKPDGRIAAAIEDLGRLGRERPALLPASKILEKALIAVHADAEPAPPPIDPTAVERAGRAGQPFFRVEPPDLDPGRLRERARRLSKALAKDLPGARDFARRAELDRWIGAFLDGRRPEIDGGPLGLDPDQASSLFRLVMIPSLALRADRIDTLRPEGAWAGRGCPDCGHDNPVLAESRGLEARRFLRCGDCSGEWPIARMGCPSCGEADPQLGRYAFEEGDEARRRLSACDACGWRVVVVSTLGRLSAPALLVAELASLPLRLAELPPVDLRR